MGDDTRTTVLHLIDCLNPGGSEQQLLHLLRVTDAKRWRPLVGVFHRGGLLRSQVEELDVPVHEFPLRTSLAHPNTLRRLFNIVALCRREQVAIVHAHDYYSNIVGVAAARLAGARSLVSRGDLAHWLRPLQRRALGLACRGAHRVVANARAVAALRSDGLDVSPKTLVVVNNAVDVEAFDREAVLEPEPPVDALAATRRMPAVVCVANMNDRAKGHADLIEALAMMRTAAALLLVGDGVLRAELEARASALGLADRVHFLGRRLDVPRLLRRADVACLPSHAEGLPNSVLEAMLAGLPVVVTAVGGCPEFIDDGRNGLLVPPGNVTELGRALDRILSDGTAARAMGARARATVATRFNLRRFGEAYAQLYVQLAGSEIERRAHESTVDGELISRAPAAAGFRPG
jgi:glycosyltransferase involved in cell wall biosynthesis